MKYNYYPGCSLERNATAYHISAVAATKPFGVEFVEIEDWNCCGATEYISLNLLAAYSLITRNLALAAKQNNGGQLVAPCSACFLNEQDRTVPVRITRVTREGQHRPHRRWYALHTRSPAGTTPSGYRC